MRRKRIKPGQFADVRLTRRERDLILERTLLDDEMEERLRGATASGSNVVVQLTLDDVDDLAGHVRHLDDRAPDRIVTTAEVRKGDSAYASIGVRAEHARHG
jgi:hypothetical protein